MHFNNEISNLIFDTVGKKESYNQSDKVSITSDLFSYFTDAFISKCNSVVSLNFYKYALFLYDYYINKRYDRPTDRKEKDKISIRKRILQYIIEAGCDINLTSYKSLSKKEIDEIFADLFIIGKDMFLMANLKAEAIMDDSTFDISVKDDRLLLERTKRYKEYINKLKDDFEDQINNSVVPENYYNDFVNALKNSFKVDIDKFVNSLSLYVNNENKIGSFHPLQFGLIFSAYLDIELDEYRDFMKGLTISKDNKRSLEDIVFKPNSLYRLIYRPFVEWKIDDTKRILYTVDSVLESIDQLAKNVIPFGETPDSWQNNDSFKSFVNTQQDIHEKWLINSVTSNLSDLSLFYDKNVKKLLLKNSTLNLSNEFDILIVSIQSKKIFVCECKYFKGRFDIQNQLNDYNKLTNKFNVKLEDKIKIAKENIKNIESHFKRKNDDFDYNISSFNIEGLFIINTPTFYQYLASPFKIISLSEVKDFFKG